MTEQRDRTALGGCPGNGELSPLWAVLQSAPVGAEIHTPGAGVPGTNPIGRGHEWGDGASEALRRARPRGWRNNPVRTAGRGISGLPVDAVISAALRKAARKGFVVPSSGSSTRDGTQRPIDEEIKR